MHARTHTPPLTQIMHVVGAGSDVDGLTQLVPGTGGGAGGGDDGVGRARGDDEVFVAQQEHGGVVLAKVGRVVQHQA